jgi:hypothetical protein
MDNLQNQSQSPQDGWVKSLLGDKAFLASVIVLLIAALGVQTTASYMKLHFRKLPVPLVKPLQEFDPTGLWPYKLVKREVIHSEVEEALGTKDYAQLRIEDSSILAENDPARYLNFFVTYYTGDPDQVPHVPDVCYLGGGYNPAGSKNMTVKVPGVGLSDDELPVRILFFKNPRTITPVVQTVVYFFYVNGAFVADRTNVRLHLADLRLKYAYFSKVEVSFACEGQPTAEQAAKIAEKFFAKAVPVLMRDHWVDWNKFIAEKKK